MSSPTLVNGKPAAADRVASQSEARSASELDDTTELWSAWAAVTDANSARTRVYFRWQRAIDLALAALLLIPSLPIIGLLVVLVRITSRGPGIYRQMRVGRHGRTFRMYKIRSMRQDAEAGTGAVWAQQRDPRVTPIGRVLRKLHLDEFPQVFNVLKGEMSFIGPRPERPEFVHVLAKQIPDYLGRLAVRPGVTGLAQVNLDPDTDLDSVRRKLTLDLEYVHEAGLGLDLRLFLCTVIHILGVSGDMAKRLTRVRREVNLTGCAGAGVAGAESSKPQQNRQPVFQCAGASKTQPQPPRPSSGSDRDILGIPTPAAIAAKSHSHGNGWAVHAGNGRIASTGNSPIPQAPVIETCPVANGSLLNAFTVDVEDYFQVSAFEHHIPRIDWDRIAPRVVASTHRILRLLDRHQVKATFFILGWIASRQPRLVREIHDAGHEIGSHGYWHRLIYDQTPDDFRRDVRQSRDVLAEIIGQEVTAYRAPSFSITRESLWALDILAEEGYKVDSSVVPVYHDRYGIPDAKSYVHTLDTTAGSIVECPPAVVQCGPWNLPVGGGGYFRLYPLCWTLRCLKGINRRQQPFMFYVHPWEVDPDQPVVAAGSRTSRFRHRVNLATTERKLDQLLQELPFGRVCDLVQQAGLRAEPTERPTDRAPVELAVGV